VRVWKYRRVITITAFFAAVALFTLLIYRIRLEQNASQREAGYQSALREYSAVLMPGATRKEVEGILRSKGAQFHRECCGGSIAESSDLVRIGSDPDNWVCVGNPVYLEIQFDVADVRSQPRKPVSDGDIYTSVTVIHKPGTCL